MLVLVDAEDFCCSRIRIASLLFLRKLLRELSRDLLGMSSWEATELDREPSLSFLGLRENLKRELLLLSLLPSRLSVMARAGTVAAMVCDDSLSCVMRCEQAA